MNQSWIRLLPAFIREKVEGRHYLQNVIHNTGWLFFDNMLRMAVGLIVGVWVARYLGPQQYGTLNYALAFVALFSSIVTLGLDGIVVRDIIKDPAHKEEILGSAFALKLLGGAATFLLSTAFIFALRPGDGLTRWLVLIIAAGTVFQAFDTIDFWFQSQLQTKYTVFAKNTALLIASLFKVVLILLKATLIWFAWISLFEIVLSAAGLIIAYRNRGFVLSQWKASYHRALGLLNDSWPLILSGLAIYTQAKIDQVMIGQMVGAAEVGQYSAAMRLIEAFGILPVIVHNSVAPAVTEAKLMGEQLYRTRLLNLYRIMVLLFLMTAIPIFLFSEQIVVTLLGDQFRKAGFLLSLFAIRLFFANMGVAKSLFITNENLFRYSMMTAVIGAIANIVCNYLLIPVYASAGAIIAMIISFFITIFFIDCFYAQMRSNLKIMLKATITPWKVALH